MKYINKINNAKKCVKYSISDKIILKYFILYTIKPHGKKRITYI